MHPSTVRAKRDRRLPRAAMAGLSALCIAALSVPLVAHAEPQLPVSPEYFPTADIGFHDLTRTGAEREIRNDLSGDLAGQVELVQSSSVAPSGNADDERPTTVADREALLLLTPTSAVSSLEVEVSVNGEAKGKLALQAPSQLPAADQSFDNRGEVAYSTKAWSAQLPWQWMRPGISLKFTDGNANSGSIDQIDVAAPTELVINNIELGMLTEAPADKNHKLLSEPVPSGTDYFTTMPLSKLTVAKYDTVELDEVIVRSGEIYTKENPDPSEGGVYGGTMRGDVAKAQFSTGVNLATWGITSGPIDQRQPGYTNQRVIHHAAGLYSNGRQFHGLSGGNGMATLLSSTGNELSHELGHSYGLGHFPGRDANATGDDIIRNASHHMDSGWGYISYRNLMRSNLNPNAYKESVDINGDSFAESLAGKYNFNTDSMAGGWDASPVSDYTHYTAYSQKRIQNYLKSLVADTSYPSGYRQWDSEKGVWADAKQLDPNFDLLKPATVGGSVFTILGGYNPADSKQTLVYPAFRSNYGVTFDFPEANTKSEQRVCWLQVDYADGSQDKIQLDSSDGVKQLNVNLAEADKPTAAQVNCSENGTSTALGNKINIATDLEPMPKAVTIGQEAGYEALRKQELNTLQPKLEAQASKTPPSLSAADMIKLRGWSDDLSQLNNSAKKTAEKILAIEQDASIVKAYLAENGEQISKGSKKKYQQLVDFLEAKNYAETDGQLLPSGTPVIVSARCLYVDDQKNILVDPQNGNCADKHSDTWYADTAGRIHHADYPALCLTANANPVTLQKCSTTNMNQRWVLDESGTVIRQDNANSALDYFWTKGYPGTYYSTGNPNQI